MKLARELSKISLRRKFTTVVAVKLFSHCSSSLLHSTAVDYAYSSFNSLQFNAIQIKSDQYKQHNTI